MTTAKNKKKKEREHGRITRIDRTLPYYVACNLLIVALSTP